MKHGLLSNNEKHVMIVIPTLSLDMMLNDNPMTFAVNLCLRVGYLDESFELNEMDLKPINLKYL